MHNARLKRVSLAVCFAFMPVISDAAGLGKLTVISALGQPLNAEIELLSTSQEELASLSARIAPNEVFETQGIEKASALSAVSVQIGKRSDGTPILRLTSSQPINEPFLDMLIQVEWSTGRLLREYTALLDPPGYGEQPLVPAAVLPAVESGQPAMVPGGPGEKPAAKARARGAGAAVASAAPEEAAGTYTTRKGDTLRAIAMQNPIDGVSLEQMLVGLYRANQEAFVGNNMNRLKVGQILRLPSQEELQAVSQQEAVREIRVQAADWNAYRNKLAGMVAEAAPTPEEVPAQASGGKVATAEDKSVPPPPPGPRDVVRLSKSEAGAAKSGGDVAGKLAALQEEATAREKALKEADARIASLEKQLQDMQKLLEIKSKPLAEAQQSAKAPAPAPAPAAKPAEPPAPAKPVEPQPSKPAQAAKPEEPAKAAPAAGAPLPDKAEVKPQPKKPKKIAPPPPAPAPEPGLLDSLLGNPLVLGGAGGLLALLGGVWFFLRNKRRKGLDSFEQGILTSGGLKPNTVFGNTAGGTVDTGSTSFLTDFGQGASTGMIDTNEVDPIAEAEVYMAYGRDAQAEEILKDAIAKEPKRYELHLKLLEIYLARKDVSAFETIAGEMYASLGGNDPTWAKVAELGRRLEPDNPLYGEGAAPAKAEETPVDFAATMIQQPAAATEASAIDIVAEAAVPEPTLDFSLDEPVAQQPEAAGTASESGGLDLDIGSLELPEQAPAAAAAEQALPDLGTSLPALELPEAGPAGEKAPEEPPELAGGGLDLSLELPEPAAAENVQLDVSEIGMEALPELSALEAPPASEASLEMPALVPEPAGMAEPVAEAALELPALDVPPQAEAPAVPPPEQAPAEEIGLELPALEMPVEQQPAVATETEEISLDLPVEPMTAETAEPQPAMEEPATGEAGGLDLDFNIDLGEPAPQAETPAPAAPPLADLDLSGISLDIGEDASAPGGSVTEEITLGGASDESPEVDTKLDLVTAYIDMGDQEGARELLQEVLREGGPKQREKAQKLLDGLG